jgi:hypothetical protein
MIANGGTVNCSGKYHKINITMGVGLDLPSTTSWVDPGSYLNRFPTKPSKTIGPPGKLEGNIAHKEHSATSPEIDLWVTANIKCLQYRNEWGYGSVFYLLHALIWLCIQILLGFIHLLSHACILVHLVIIHS